LLYVFPVVFAVGGVNFPIGVLIYWFTTNLWSMGQQFYVIRNNPQPGTPAFEALEARKKEKAARKAARKAGGPAAAGTATLSEDEEVTDEASETPKRVQPKKAPRSKRKKK